MVLSRNAQNVLGSSMGYWDSAISNCTKFEPFFGLNGQLSSTEIFGRLTYEY